MIRHTFLIFSILVSVAVTLSEAATTAAYNPTDVFLFNCGDTSNNTDNTGWNWTAENLKSLPWNSVNASFSSNANFQESGSDFDADNFFFSVTVNNDFTLLKNSSADLMVKASKDFTLIKGFIVPVDQTTLKLTFRPSPKSLAFVNGIEIVSMPDGFYSKGGFDDRISNTGSTIDFQIQNSTVFETLYRLNVAGETVRDTGMFRRWISDDEFILGSMGTAPSVPGVKIKYTEKTPAYVAPEDVYATYRPPMNRVVEMMEGSLDALEVPPKPSMHISTGLISDSSSVVDMMEESLDALEDPRKSSMDILAGHNSESSSVVDGIGAG
ncbi:hypothetical protein AALP_AA5G039000 [Arabis alpina]|uniref:Uncharacterized protein n=1 Tax=Arabis alpina TaxID=50452 RepID=A0A087GUT1_ARAAL|nr:hypothetical protein AALP_AA5G039000 [Arabis alpina]